MPVIAPLAPADRAEWEVLARGYKAFYRTETSDADYDRTWRRLLRAHDVHGLGARVDGQLVGLAHYMFHTNAWMADACYLQDLFVAETARGHGVARALIEAVAEIARKHGCPRYYLQTQENNARACALYDKVARWNGFIRYDYPL